jgi:hypothetical protein
VQVNEAHDPVDGTVSDSSCRSCGTLVWSIRHAIVHLPPPDDLPREPSVVSI